jgi:hypothetical protein
MYIAGYVPMYVPTVAAAWTQMELELKLTQALHVSIIDIYDHGHL